MNKGENNLKIIIINKISDLEDMFNLCESLYNIYELKYLNTKDITYFRRMLRGSTSLSDIKQLDFGDMFNGCSSLPDIKGLQNWNVLNANIFEGMLYGCSSEWREKVEFINKHVSSTLN